MVYLIIIQTLIIVWMLLFVLKPKKEKQNRILTLKETVEQKFSEMVSYNTHFSNIISGINHEVSPWIGGIANITPLIKRILLKENFDIKDIEYYLDRIDMACKQGSDVFKALSQNVKQLKQYSVFNTCLGDTVLSWGQLNLIDNHIKGFIDRENLNIQISSLTFDCFHSPMLLSQIIYNIVKNSIDHNTDTLENLIIKIYGNGKNTLIIEDNGSGLQEDVLRNIFKLGFTTKKTKDKVAHGIGLATCLDYCILMGAKIKVSSVYGEYTRFTIKFRIENESTDNFYDRDSELNLPCIPQPEIPQISETSLYKKTPSQAEKTILKHSWDKVCSDTI